MTTVSIGMPLHHVLLPPRIRASGNLKDYIADVDVYAPFSYSGQQPVKPASFTLILKSSASGALFGSNPSLILLVDDRRLKMGNMQQRVVYHEQRIVEEYISAEIPSDIFLSLANADF